MNSVGRLIVKILLMVFCIVALTRVNYVCAEATLSEQGIEPGDLPRCIAYWPYTEALNLPATVESPVMPEARAIPGCDSFDLSDDTLYAIPLKTSGGWDTNYLGQQFLRTPMYTQHGPNEYIFGPWTSYQKASDWSYEFDPSVEYQFMDGVRVTAPEGFEYIPEANP